MDVLDRVCILFSVFIYLKECILSFVWNKKEMPFIIYLSCKNPQIKKKKVGFCIYNYLSLIFVRFLKLMCSFVIYEKLLRNVKLKVWIVTLDPVIELSLKWYVVNRYSALLIHVKVDREHKTNFSPAICTWFEVGMEVWMEKLLYSAITGNLAGKLVFRANPFLLLKVMWTFWVWW